MYSITSAEKKILSQSTAQLAHYLEVTQQNACANLLHRRLPLLSASDAPAGTPDTTSLNNILNSAVEVPGTTSIATVPPAPDTGMYQMLGQIQTLDSYISLLTAYCVYNEHPAPYDISKPKDASDFARAMAKWRNYVITGGSVKALAGYLPVSQITAQSYSKEVTSAELHLSFLGELFSGFSFPKAALTELDSILTKVVAKLGTMQVSFNSEDATLDHFLTYYYFATVAGTGGEGQPPAMYVAKIRTFFLHIDQSSWKVSVGKSSVSKFKFNMNYYDMDTTMNSNLVATDMQTINSAIQTLTGKQASEVNALMNMQAIHADPQKS
ncbi:hypothetical protein [Comamonas avium]|jgi:hypothetical protein|uniref:Virulence factor Evf domain-containing protein n=1 Tax=Comamonas avium TaxID=2762231 RepID=A0ABR8SF72_9BURK|nr:hypothetical protein [Comamonas avium]MBD7961984.1 hypothetical protein [Comamonas avium]